MNSSGYGPGYAANSRGGEAFRYIALLAAAGMAYAQPGSVTKHPIPSGTPALIDRAGNVFIADIAQGSNLPVTTGAAQTQSGGGTCASFAPIGGPLPRPCWDAYIAKADTTGKLVWATLLGGNTDDIASVAAVDSSGNVYVAGITGGSFPVTPGAAVPSLPDKGAFAAKVSADGSRFVYVTYLPVTISASAIAVDSQGNAFITGVSSSNHAVVVKVSTDGAAIPWVTILQGSGQEAATGIVLDSAGDPIVIGQTSSKDFPVSKSAVQSYLAGAQDAFITKLDSTGLVVASTYLGGSDTELGYGVQVDSSDNIYVGGSTASLDFPTTILSFAPIPQVPLSSMRGPGGFIARLSPDLSKLSYSYSVLTADGPASIPSGLYSLSVTAAGDAYFYADWTGGSLITASAPLPCTTATPGLFVGHVSPDGAFADSSFVDVNASRIAATGDGAVWIAGQARGIDTPFAALEQLRFGGSGWSAAACLSSNVFNAATMYASGRIAPGELITLTGFGLGPEAGVVYQPGPNGEAPLKLGGARVLVDGQPVPVIYAQSRQVNAIAPMQFANSSATIQAEYNGQLLGSTAADVIFADPALFRLRAGYSTQAAAINEDGTINGMANPALPGSVVQIWGTGFGTLARPCAAGSLNAPYAVNLAPGASVQLNGSNSLQVTYAGGAPNTLCGMQQVNVRIPADTPTGLLTLYPWSNLDIGNSHVGVQTSIGSTVVVK